MDCCDSSDDDDRSVCSDSDTPSECSCSTRGPPTPAPGPSGSKAQRMDSIFLEEPLLGGKLNVDVVARILSHLSSWNDIQNSAAVSRTWCRAGKLAVTLRAELSLAGSRAGDNKLAKLDAHLNLTSLDLWGCNLTDESLVRFGTSLAPRLKRLSLWSCTRVTEQGLSEFLKLARSLEHLDLGGTAAGPMTMQAVANLDRLRTLNLWYCRNITDEALQSLQQGCPSLQSVRLWATLNVSHCAVGTLQLARPALVVEGLESSR